MDLEAYLPILLFILVGIAVGIAPQVMGFMLGPRRPDAAKNSPYECGFEAFEDARMKFDVRYYLVAILFVLFDLEMLFMIPWAVSLRDIGATGFWGLYAVSCGMQQVIPRRLQRSDAAPRRRTARPADA